MHSRRLFFTVISTVYFYSVNVEEIELDWSYLQDKPWVSIHWAISHPGDLIWKLKIGTNPYPREKYIRIPSVQLIILLLHYMFSKNRFLFNSVVTTWLLPQVASSMITVCYSLLKHIILDIWNIKIKMLRIIFMLTNEPPCITHFCLWILRKHIYESKDTVAGIQSRIEILTKE